MQIKGKICFISIDVERNIDNLERILEVFKRYGVLATLFVTGEILAKYSTAAKVWQKNYEIACHSFTHRFWSALNYEERRAELDDFINLYQRIFQSKPLGFRAPSHIIDEAGLKLLQEAGFLYDSSIVPHYPPFKKYRGYKGRSPLLPYYPQNLKILEIPVRGQIFGIPLAGAWMCQLPFWFFRLLFFIHCPSFITISIHSWDNFKNLDKIFNLIKKKNYQFLNGEQIFKNSR